MGLGSWFAGAVVVTLFTGISLAHEWVEYRRAFRQHAQAQPATGFELDANAVIIQQENHRRTLGWRDFYSIQRVSDWVLLYTSVEHCYYLNLTQVQTPATAADVLALLPQRPVSAE
ncbi:YcxB family protein [Hymenobacter sp. 5414T-23]|nr:YcxB family protein [Hymenobacter sp. 5414T-23]UOQ82820.1 YcxB family protein [Hymenobacter sp. 5414T-23]